MNNYKPITNIDDINNMIKSGHALQVEDSNYMASKILIL